jgi:teichuronic acid biosynthesis glycosyltransferase TuaH
MELKDKTILILGAAKFDDIYESTSFTTAKYLALNNDVFYIDYPYTVKDYFKLKETDKFKVRKDHFGSNDTFVIHTAIERLKVIVTPMVLSINFLPEGFLYRILLRFNERRIASKIKKILKFNNITDFIYINSFKFHYPNLGRLLNPVLKIYQCVDPLIIDYDKKHGEVSERQIVLDSDIVICTSKQLYREKVKVNKNTFFIPNAADIDHSSKAMDPKLKIHSNIIDIPKPIIGYFGHIERRIDFNLLKSVVVENPDKSFVFAGPVSEEFIPPDFKTHKNVYFTGRVPYAEMPAIIKGFDIAIIPFKKDDVSDTIFPLKLFEYLGAGKPVITTDFNLDLKEFTGDTVSYCGDADSFSDAIRFYLKNDNPQLKRERLSIAELNTWHNRIFDLGIIINDQLERKSSNKNLTKPLNK